MYDGQIFKDDGRSAFDNGAGVNLLDNPMFTEMYLEEQAVNSVWRQPISTWKEIETGKNNRNVIRIRQRTPAVKQWLHELGKDGAMPTIKIDGGEGLMTRGIQRALNIPRGLVGSMVLPEGSSGNRMAIGASGRAWKEKGVVPIGFWDTFTEEDMMFRSEADLAYEIREMSKITTTATDAFYRDTLFYTAGFRYDFTALESGYNNLQSPILGKLIDNVVDSMQMYGAKNFRAITSSFSDYGTTPVNAEMVMYVPIESAQSFRDNAKFVPPERYSNNTVFDGEIGILGRARIVVQEGMVVRECKGRLIADMYIIANDPLVGLKLQGKKAMEGYVKYPKMGENADRLGRAGSYGIKSWVGALNIHPERTAVISMYINHLSPADYITMDKACGDSCKAPCVEDSVATTTECVDGKVKTETKTTKTTKKK